jgi:Caudovirus prohead serine protease
MPELISVPFDRVDLAADPGGRRISGLAVPFGVPSGPSWLTGIRYQFDGPPANAGDLLDVTRNHDDDAVVGRLAAALDAQDDGLHATARIFTTTAGSDVLVEASEGVLTGFSISAEVTEWSTDQATDVRTVTAWSARHLAVVRRPAFTESRGLTVAASAQEGPTMPTATATPPVTPAPPATPSTPAAPAVAQLPTIAELAAQVGDALRAELTAAAASGRHPLAAFARESDYVHALDAADDTERARLIAAFAVPDQTTGDNPGVMTPQWRSVIQMNLDARRPAITGTGGPINLPDSGMTANWPYYDGDLDAIIGPQATEKTDLAGVKISIKSATKPILTAGTVSDISYQLLLRSSPAYLEAYLSICRAAWARYTEARFELAVAAAATAAGTAPDPSDASLFAGWLFEQSQAVEDATGSPATVVGVASDAWLALGALESLINPGYGPQNAQGLASAATLRLEVNGLRITRWPFLAAGQVVVTNGSAVRFAEQGPMVANGEDVRKLGRDVAVWGMYEEAEVYFPAGVLLGTAVAGP